jgi:hypothetical protein
MDVERRLERLCERVTLVNSIGSRRRDELCVMSFVALLAGERHTDHPASASPLIRNLAIPVNDALPDDVRQRLRPFAALILGTNDGHDRDRARVLHQVLAEEILPRVRRDWGSEQVAEWCRVPLEFLFAGAVEFVGTEERGSKLRVEALLLQLEHQMPRGYEASVGSAAGQLLAQCMREATTLEQQSWYWDKAMSLLNRLCSVRPEPREETIRVDCIARAEKRLDEARAGNACLNGTSQLLRASCKAAEPV